MNVAIFVPALVGGILLFNALIWGGIFHWARSRMARARAAFDAEVARTGERVIIAPERANYSGGTGTFPAVSGTGVVALTDRRLRFQKLTGGIVEIPIADLASLDLAARFRSQRIGGRRFLVLTTRDYATAAFVMPDTSRWTSALTSAGVAMGHG